jgi:hypothetical protein
MENIENIESIEKGHKYKPSYSERYSTKKKRARKKKENSNLKEKKALFLLQLRENRIKESRKKLERESRLLITRQLSKIRAELEMSLVLEEDPHFLRESRE